MISLDAITLPKELVWVDEKTYAPVKQRVRETLGGSPFVSAQPLQGGRPITLVARQRRGWMTRATVNAIDTLAAQAGGIFTLVIGAQSFQLTFRHDDPPAANLTPLVTFRVDAPDEDLYIGTLKFMTI